MKKFILYCSLSAFPMQGLIAQVTKLQVLKPTPTERPVEIRMR